MSNKNITNKNKHTKKWTVFIWSFLIFFPISPTIIFLYLFMPKEIRAFLYEKYLYIKNKF